MSETILRRYRLNPPGNPFALWSLILGVAGFCVPFVGGAAAVVLGGMGVARARKSLTGQGPSVAGIVLGVLSILMYVLFWVAGHAISGWFNHPPPPAPQPVSVIVAVTPGVPGPHCGSEVLPTL